MLESNDYNNTKNLSINIPNNESMSNMKVYSKPNRESNFLKQNMQQDMNSDYNSHRMDQNSLAEYKHHSKKNSNIMGSQNMNQIQSLNTSNFDLKPKNNGNLANQ